MPFSVTYSSYSNSPLNSGLSRWNLSFAKMNWTYALIKGPYPIARVQVYSGP